MFALDLSRIRTAHERIERVYAPGDFATDASDGFTIAAPVELAFDIYKDKQQFRLIGTVKTTLELPCSRCLEPFVWPVEASFDLRYQPHAHNTGEGEREIEEDDLTTAFYEHDMIDLQQLMKEQFLLSLPMKPLCTDACRGLCPVCGTNLNRTTCTCTEQWEDPRFAALKALTTKPTTQH
jgi:uncharacterized protein